MPLWLIIVLVVLAVLTVGGVDRPQPPARALTPRVRARAARRSTTTSPPPRRATAAGTARSSRPPRAASAPSSFGAEPEELTLVEVIDRPGTDDDQAVFDVSAGGERHRVVLGRRDGDWVHADSRRLARRLARAPVLDRVERGAHVVEVVGHDAAPGRRRRAMLPVALDRVLAASRSARSSSSESNSTIGK